MRKFNIDVDKPFLPYMCSSTAIFSKLPNFISRFCGYRDTSPTIPGESRKHGPRLHKPLPDIAKSAWILVSTFAGLILVSCVMKYATLFSVTHDVPIIVPSWGATSILLYNAIESPLAQPRNAYGGTFIASFCGVALTKLVMTNPDNEQYLWVTGCLGVAIASIAMGVTKTVHPPGGAAAFIPAIDPGTRAIGWYYLVVQLVSGLLMTGVALVFNNIQRRYPIYWVTPVKLRATFHRGDEVEPAKPADAPVAKTEPAPPAPAHLKDDEKDNANNNTNNTTNNNNNNNTNNNNWSDSDSYKSGREAAATHSIDTLGGLPANANPNTLSLTLSKSKYNFYHTDNENNITAVSSNPFSRSRSAGNIFANALGLNESAYGHVIGTQESDTGDLVLPSYHNAADESLDARDINRTISEVISHEEDAVVSSATNNTHNQNGQRPRHSQEPLPAVVMLANHFALPKGLELTEEEQILLGRIQEQLQDLQRVQEEEMMKQGDDLV